MDATEVPTDIRDPDKSADTIPTPGRIAFATLTGVFACFWALGLVVVILGRHQAPSKAPEFSASMVGSMIGGILLVYLASLIGVLARRQWGWYLTVLLAMFWLMAGVAVGAMPPSGGTPKRAGLVMVAFLVAVALSYLVYFWRRSIRRAFAVELPWIDLWAWFSVCAGLGGVLIVLKYSLPTQIFWWVLSGKPGRVLLGLLGVASLAAGIGVMRRTRWGWTLAVMVLVCSVVNGVIVALFPHPEVAARLKAAFPSVVVTPDQLRGAWKWFLPWLAYYLLVGVLLLVHRQKFTNGTDSIDVGIVDQNTGNGEE